jgi:choline-sulfatase
VKRRDVLRASAALPVLAAADQIDIEDAEAKKGHKRKKRKGKKHSGRNFAGMNVVLFITDQQRKTMYFPPKWEEENLEAATRLKRTGLSFENAFCNACMCSPSRATLFTGFFPAQHGVKYTLEEVDNPPPTFLQSPLPLDFPNLARMMTAAGYRVPYKGKWHLSKPIEADWTPEDVNQYGFQRWNPPDAGANQDLDQFGGGDADNDGRFMDDDGPAPLGKEGVLEYLESEAAKEQPFFLVVSLVNPHDVLSYPREYKIGGYNDSDLRGDIGLPPTVHENLDSKPTVQKQFLALTAVGLGPLPNDQDKVNYLNFYGNLMKESDDYLNEVIEKLEHENLLENTLIIQTSDHGEMGMSHGGLRQKNFNFYEETLRVPLTYSNPRLFKKAETSNAMVSHVDLLPTIASLLNVPQSARQAWQGVDYSRVVRKPQKHKQVQDYVVFTFDDIQSGQPNPPYPLPPNHIVSIRESRYKLAKYYDPDGNAPVQWEMYDLKQDPTESTNLAAPGFQRNKTQEKEFQRLQNKLAQVEATRLQPL